MVKQNIVNGNALMDWVLSMIKVFSYVSVKSSVIYEDFGKFSFCLLDILTLLCHSDFNKKSLKIFEYLLKLN